MTVPINHQNAPPIRPPAGELVILCEQQREHVYTIGPAWGPMGSAIRGSATPVFVTWEKPVTCFSVRCAQNVIAAWQRKTGIADVVFVPAHLQSTLGGGA